MAGGHITITPNDMRDAGYLLTREAARKIGVANTTVYRWLQAGKVDGIKDGFRSYVKWSSVLKHLGPDICEIKDYSEDDLWIITELDE